MEKRKTRALASLVVIIACLVGVVIGSVYWTRTVNLKFSTIGINAECLQWNFAAGVNTAWSNYQSKNIATSLDSENKLVIVIFAENFHAIWLSSSVSGNWSVSNPIPFNITASYVSYQWNAGSGEPSITVGTAFHIGPGNFTVDKSKMMWQPIVNSVGSPIGGGLLLQVTPLTGEYTAPGNWLANIILSLGYT